MQMYGPQLGVSVGFPLALALGAWLACRRSIPLGWLALGLTLGALSIFPVVRLVNVLEPWIGSRERHSYAESLIQEFLTTGLPEEWGKGLVAVLLWWLMRRPSNPLSWLSCAASSYCGFAALEGLLGASGNEGPLKVIVGRSMGATLHCSWGIMAAWWAWRGSVGGRPRALNGCLALLVPAGLHAIGNVGQLDTFGSDAPVDGSSPTVAELQIALAGLFSELATLGLAVWSVCAARKIAPGGANPLLVRTGK